jgi:hypothetical protein
LVLKQDEERMISGGIRTNSNSGRMVSGAGIIKGTGKRRKEKRRKRKRGKKKKKKKERKEGLS